MNYAEIDALVAERSEARKAKRWAEADEIRERLMEMGVVVEDGRHKSDWRAADRREIESWKRGK